jgi:MOSC domain-containing protein YiiM
MTGRIVQLAISSGGVPKLPIDEGRVTLLGIVGDVQKHIKIHGGPERALSLFSLEVIEKLQAEGHPIAPGSTGENVTICGLDWASLAKGSRLALGDEVIVEITRPADPCKTIADSFTARDFKRLERPGEMRFYTQVLQEGTLRTGDVVRVLG